MAFRSWPSLHVSSRILTFTVLNSSRSTASFQHGVLPVHRMSGRVFSVPRAQVRDEEAAAKVAVEIDGPTIFDKIVSKEIPATIVYETEKVLAFRDINPQAPVHVVLIPKLRDGLTQLSKASERNKDVLGELLYAAKVVAEQEELEKGFRIVINDGPDGCQSVYHLHLHLLGGRQLKWPPG